MILSEFIISLAITFSYNFVTKDFDTVCHMSYTAFINNHFPTDYSLAYISLGSQIHFIELSILFYNKMILEGSVVSLLWVMSVYRIIAATTQSRLVNWNHYTEVITNSFSFYQMKNVFIFYLFDQMSLQISMWKTGRKDTWCTEYLYMWMYALRCFMTCGNILN